MNNKRLNITFNFNNKDTLNHLKVAESRWSSAEDLYLITKTGNLTEKCKLKRYNTIQELAMEVIEHCFKSVFVAVDPLSIKHLTIKGKPIDIDKVRITHNLSVLQEVNEKIGFDILSAAQIKEINDAIQETLKNNPSKYNAIRYIYQEIDDGIIYRSLHIAKEAINNVNKYMEENQNG